MKITRTTVAAAAACVALVTGSAVASQAHGATPTVTTTDAEHIDGIAVRAGNEAVLAQLCRDSAGDPTARAAFDATAAAHPELAAQLDASCAPITPAP